jgi:uncharacterized protein YndB with AHSA1/START domain/mannose-6-phosphate isomerase-like protein (cupin superfamily)
MARPGDVIEVPEVGLRFDVRATAESTGGEYVEVDVIGRPRGFIRAAHVHRGQRERHEVIAGAMKVGFHGRTHVLRPGDAIEVPPDTPHTQLPDGPGAGHTRVTVRPAGRVEAFFERLGELSARGELNRFGYPRPQAAARMVLELGDEGHAARPPLRVQQAVARAVLRAGRPYEFVDEWDVAAPPEAVFDTLADARSYPDWWRPVYIGVEAGDGPPAVGDVSRQHFTGRLPYHLRTRTIAIRLERPHLIEFEVDGDLRGRGIWTLTPTAGGGTHVRFDWRVHADRPLLRALTPLLRPALRWNHNWAIARARDGLEPYAQALSRSAAAR